MQKAFGYSILLHVSVMAAGYIGLPYIQTSPLLTDTPIMVEIVNVDEVTNAPPPKPKPKVAAKKEPAKPKPKVVVRLPRLQKLRLEAKKKREAAGGGGSK